MRGSRRYLDSLQANWNTLAETDAMWAVLSDPAKRGRWDEAEFFKTGRDEIDALFAQLAEVALERRSREDQDEGESANALEPRLGEALDFGCGVGRLSQALATRFAAVTGIDISPRMIELANKYDHSGGKCRFRVVDTGDLSDFERESFDFVCSKIVLQHIRPAQAEEYLREFARVLRPGGVAVFQIPGEIAPTLKGRIMRLLNTRPLLPVWNLYRRVRHRMRAHMEMHGIPEVRVRAVAASAGLTVEKVWRDGKPMSDWINYQYACRKSVPE